jgi:hypothetical protein
VANCRNQYARLATAHPRLARYAANANANIAARPGVFLTANLQELVYYGVLRLTLLAPDIVEAILNGRQRAEMTLTVVMRPFPISWREQHEAGFILAVQ